MTHRKHRNIEQYMYRVVPVAATSIVPASHAPGNNTANIYI